MIEVKRVKLNQTIILLLNGNSAAYNSSVKKWLENGRISTCEATNVFQALEEISDFTVRSCPDVVLLEVSSPSEDFYTVQKMMQASFGECQISIFPLSDSCKIVNRKQSFKGNLAQLKAKLKKLIPNAAAQASASA